MMMKRLISGAAMAFVLSSPVLAHHPAEDIISDDIWQRIDDMLEAADSPHLSLDFDDPMGSMAVASVGGSGSGMAMATSITVPTDDAEEYLIYVEEAIGMVQGETDSGSASGIFVETEDLGNGFTEITVYEPIGAVTPPGSSRGR